MCSQPLPKLFSKRLVALRKAHGWTQEQAAEACGVGYKLFQLYELGIKDNPGLKTLEKVARGFGIGVHELLAPELPVVRVGLAKRRLKPATTVNGGC